MVKDLKPIDILLVEDNEGDILLTEEVFDMSKIRNNIHITHDGDQALHFLKKTGAYKKAVTPDLILLDINLPKKNGIEVFEEIKADSHLCNIPVVILTGSSYEKKIIKDLELEADCYIIKPLDLDKIIHILNHTETLCLSVVKSTDLEATF